MEDWCNIWKGAQPFGRITRTLLTSGYRETWSWDVRTKHVTYDPIPTIDGVRGIANYGPTATLFTIGPQHSVQQYDLENPAMVKMCNIFQSSPGLAPRKTVEREQCPHGVCRTLLISENHQARPDERHLTQTALRVSDRGQI